MSTHHGNTAPPREDVLATAMEMIAERGLEKLTMAALGLEVGMSSGHLLYYFHSKDELPLRTWNRARGGSAPSAGGCSYGHRQPANGSTCTSACTSPTAIATRTGPLEVWNRSKSAAADADARERQAATEGAWHRDLVALLTEGISHSEFRPIEPDRFAARLRALLDGFSIHVAIGLRGTGREQVMAYVREFLDESLALPAVVEG